MVPTELSRYICSRAKHIPRSDLALPWVLQANSPLSRPPYCQFANSAVCSRELGLLAANLSARGQGGTCVRAVSKPGCKAAMAAVAPLTGRHAMATWCSLARLEVGRLVPRYS